MPGEPIFLASSGRRQEQVEGHATVDDMVAASTGATASEIRDRRAIHDRNTRLFTMHTTQIEDTDQSLSYNKYLFLY